MQTHVLHLTHVCRNHSNQSPVFSRVVLLKPPHSEWSGTPQSTTLSVTISQTPTTTDIQYTHGSKQHNYTPILSRKQDYKLEPLKVYIYADDTSTPTTRR